MNHSAEFRRCLIECDTAGIRALWAHVSPHLPQPKTDGETLATIHNARTRTESIPLRLRAYSYAWLCDRGIPSGLPDALKPAADRMYPRVVSAVGIAVKATSPRRRAEAKALERAMADAVEDAYANGDKDPVFVRARIDEARDKFLRSA